jgi:hypothetical protein
VGDARRKISTWVVVYLGLETDARMGTRALCKAVRATARAALKLGR